MVAAVTSNNNNGGGGISDGGGHPIHTQTQFARLPWLRRVISAAICLSPHTQTHTQIHRRTHWDPGSSRLATWLSLRTYFPVRRRQRPLSALAVISLEGSVWVCVSSSPSPSSPPATCFYWMERTPTPTPTAATLRPRCLQREY